MFTFTSTSLCVYCSMTLYCLCMLRYHLIYISFHYIDVSFVTYTNTFTSFSFVLCFIQTCHSFFHSLYHSIISFINRSHDRNSHSYAQYSSTLSSYIQQDYWHYVTSTYISQFLLLFYLLASSLLTLFIYLHTSLFSFIISSTCLFHVMWLYL